LKRDVSVSVCRTCGLRLFPPRLLCPACGGASWSREPAGSGTVEEGTTVRHAVGAAGDVPVSLASVRLDAGPVVVAGVDAQARPGDRVEVTDADRVWARRVRRGSTD
jgi:uncharacterized OB-fold protein